MDEGKRNLMGSPFRDAFKKAHKDYNDGSCYASDLDLVLVVARPEPGVVAFLDCKRPREGITFAEVLLYNALLQATGRPIYIVHSPDPVAGPFSVYQYHGGDWKPDPPKTDTRFVKKCHTWAELALWEKELRGNFPTIRPPKLTHPRHTLQIPKSPAIKSRL